MVTEETQEFKDPWTRKWIDDPVTNKVCGHTYERSTVERFLANNSKSRKPTKCPPSAPWWGAPTTTSPRPS